MFTAIDLKNNETIFVGNYEFLDLKEKQLVDPIYYQEVYPRRGHERTYNGQQFFVRSHFVSKSVNVLTEPPEDVIFDPEYIYKRKGNPYYTVGESEEHIQGKEFIAEFIKNEVYPELEGRKIVYEYRLWIPSKNKYRIIDVAMLFPFGGLIAFECQLSQISFNDFEERYYDYQSTGTDSYWFFGSKAYTDAITTFLYHRQGFTPYYLDFSYPSTA